jgi:hypothetical protein
LNLCLLKSSSVWFLVCLGLILLHRSCYQIVRCPLFGSRQRGSGRAPQVILGLRCENLPCGSSQASVITHTIDHRKPARGSAGFFQEHTSYAFACVCLPTGCNCNHTKASSEASPGRGIWGIPCRKARFTPHSANAY